MKITVVVDAKGTLVAAQQKNGDKDAGLMAGPGQKVHELEVPLQEQDFKDAQQFVTKLTPHIQNIRVH